ncbi:hypothetical protein L1049_017397 [Liquidambar formosana]|uniref:Myb/SANT-like domain-containing protein n=1 Tax=Liquidambar formosana TaxID=63359 RepID=A0AAP0X3P4_LIQFO
MGKKAKNKESIDDKANSVKWSTYWDEVLLDALLEEQMKGNRPDGTWSTTAYTNVVKTLTQKLEFPFLKDHVKNRMKTLKKNFNTCYELFKGMSGFAWNPETQLFEAENEVWKELIQANAAAATWRHTRICHYDKLFELFAKDRATDKKRKADLMIDVLEKQIEVVNSGIASVADAIREGNIIVERGIAIAAQSRPRCYSEDEVFSEILNIGVPEHLQLDAFLFLIKSQPKVRAFFGVPSDRRLELLMKMMYESRDA